MAEKVKFEEMSTDEKLSAIYKECTKNRNDIKKIQKKINKMQSKDEDSTTSTELQKIRKQLNGMVIGAEMDKRWNNW